MTPLTPHLGTIDQVYQKVLRGKPPDMAREGFHPQGRSLLQFLHHGTFATRLLPGTQGVGR